MAKNALVKQFKGFVVYQVKGEADLKDLLDNPNLENLKYRIANENQLSTIGFLPVISEEVNEETGEVIQEEQLVVSVGGFDVIKIGESKKKVPANEVKKLVRDMTAKAFDEAKEKGEDFKVTKDMKDFFKDNAIKQLLPKCFTDEYESFLFHDTQSGLFYVAVTSHRKAESLTGFVRAVLGSLPLVPLHVDGSVEQVFTDFVVNQLNATLVLGNFVEMQDLEGVVAWKKESLYDSEAKELLENTEKVVTKIGLEYDGTVAFVVDTDFSFSQVKFDSAITADGHDFTSTFLLMGNEIRKSVQGLLKEIGIDA